MIQSVPQSNTLALGGISDLNHNTKKTVFVTKLRQLNRGWQLVYKCHWDESRLFTSKLESALVKNP
jgi:hypothetical protein